jgi:hypothetical protein
MQDIQKLMAYFGLGVFVFIGGVILLIALHDIYTTKSLLKDTRETTGTVTLTGTRAVETGSGPNRSTGVVDYAEIEYGVEGGDTYVFEHTYGLIEGSFEKGDNVPVYYLSDDPSEAMVNSFSSIWLTDIVIAFVALLFIGAGILVYKVVMPKKTL